MSKPLLQVKGLWKKYPIYGALGKLFRPKTYMNAVADLLEKQFGTPVQPTVQVQTR